MENFVILELKNKLFIHFSSQFDIIRKTMIKK